MGRQVDVELHVLLLRRRGKPCAAEGLVPSHHRPVVSIAGHFLVEPRQFRRQAIEGRGGIGMPVIVKDPALAQRITRLVPLGDQGVLRRSDLFDEYPFCFPVGGAQRGCALEHQMFEIVGRPQFSGLFDKSAKIRENLAGHPMISRPIEHQEPQSIIEDMLTDR